MEIVKALFPGLGLSFAILLVLLGVVQLHLYINKGYERSKNLAFFCLLNSLFAFNITIVFSKAFSDEFTRFYVEGLAPTLYLSHYFYLRSLSFFISVPRWLKKFFYTVMLALAAISMVPYPWYLITGNYIYFDPNNLTTTGNYFVDVYTTRLGTPGSGPLILIGFSGFMSALLTTVVLYRIRRSSKDIFLTIGLIFTLVAVSMDFIVLPIEKSLHIPLLFLANIFEAGRMCYLSIKEDFVQSFQTEEEVEESQHNLSIDEERLKALSVELTVLLENEDFIKDPLLKLDSIANKMNIPGYLVSQVLRFGLNTNFNTIINEYRIEYVKKNLLDPAKKKQSILDIATEAGYNSKSTFNVAFKKITGQTPSQFRKGK